MTVVFGPLWDAPVCEDATVFPEVPTHARCLHCHEHIAEGDQGLIRIYFGGATKPGYLVEHVNGCQLVAIHRECDLVNTVGHVFGVCPCTDYAGLGEHQPRKAARLLLERLDAARGAS